MNPIPDRKTIYVALIVTSGSFLPISLLHEVGHIVVCVSDGLTYTLVLKLAIFTTSCHGSPDNLFFYYAFGGGLATIVSLAPLALSALRQHTGIILALLTLATIQGINGIIETGWTDWYLNSTKEVMVVMNLILAFTVIGYMFVFAKIRR